MIMQICWALYEKYKYNIFYIFWFLSSTADLDTDSLDNRQAFSGIKTTLFIYFL
jgi:hypothetical protein